MRYLRHITVLGTVGLMVMLLLCSATAKQAAAESLRLCGTALLPSLLPFAVLSQLFVRTGADRACARLLKKPLALLGLPEGACAPMLTGLVGGFPVGLLTLKTAVDQGALRREDAIKVSRICNQAGPAFLLGATGLSLFGSLRVGLLLWAVQLLSMLATALFYRTFSRRAGSSLPAASTPGEDKDIGGQRSARPAAQPAQLAAALPDAVRSTGASLLQVCIYVIFFGTLSGLLQTLPLPSVATALCSGALELCGGLFTLAPFARKARFVLASMLLGWGGLCVHFQGLTALRTAGLPAKPYLRAKLLQSAFALLLAVPVLVFL